MRNLFHKWSTSTHEFLKKITDRYFLGRIDRNARKIQLQIGLGALLIAVVFLTFSMKSLPGTVLYGIKVNAIEPLIAHTKFSETHDATYQLKLLDRRRKETERLISKGDISEDIAQIINKQTVRVFESFKASIETSGQISQADTVTMLYELYLTLYIQERLISKTPALLTIQSAAEERTAESKDIYEAYVPLYVHSSDGISLQSYINGRLQLLLRNVDDENPDEETLTKVNRRLQNIKEAIAADDASEAILLIHEALQILKTAKYFN